MADQNLVFDEHGLEEISVKDASIFFFGRPKKLIIAIQQKYQERGYKIVGCNGNGLGRMKLDDEYQCWVSQFFWTSLVKLLHCNHQLIQDYSIR